MFSRLEINVLLSVNRALVLAENLKINGGNSSRHSLEIGHIEQIDKHLRGYMSCGSTILV